MAAIVTDREILRKPTKEVMPGDPVLEVAGELFKEMREYKAQGLSANQLGYSLSMFVMVQQRGAPICLVNPQIVKEKGWQGANERCLSLPGEVVQVIRPKEIRIKGVNPYFKPVNYKFADIEARRACHEIDHLNGKLIIDYR